MKDTYSPPSSVPNLEDEQSFELLFSRMQALAQNARKKSPTREEVSLRAYQIFLERGGAHGQDLEDWFEAEHQLFAEKR